MICEGKVCMSNKPQSFEDVYYTYKSMVSSICFTYTKNLLDAEDLIQDVFMKYHLKQPHVVSADHLKHWFIRVTLNVCKDYYKSSWKKKVQLDEERIHRQPQEYPLEENHYIFDLISEMEYIYKDVVILFYYENLSIKDISKALHKPEHTIKKRLERARHLIKESLERNKIYGSKD